MVIVSKSEVVLFETSVKSSALEEIIDFFIRIESKQFTEAFKSAFAVAFHGTGLIQVIEALNFRELFSIRGREELEGSVGIAIIESVFKFSGEGNWWLGEGRKRRQKQNGC